MFIGKLGGAGRKRFSYANVAATLALFLALTGGTALSGTCRQALVDQFDQPDQAQRAEGAARDERNKRDKRDKRDKRNERNERRDGRDRHERNDRVHQHASNRKDRGGNVGRGRANSN